MVEIIDFPARAEAAEASIGRLHLAWEHVVWEQHSDLVGCMGKMLQATRDYAPFTAAFAALTIAEMMLLRIPEWRPDDVVFRRLRSFAVDVAARMVAPGG